MRRVALFALLVVVCAGCPFQGPGRSKSGGGSAISNMEWQDKVLQSKEPVVVDFWATWCGPCRQMSPVVEALSRDYKVTKVDVDTNPELAKKYDITGIPAILVFKDGEVVDRFVGAMSESELRAKVKSALKR